MSCDLAMFFGLSTVLLMSASGHHICVSAQDLRKQSMGFEGWHRPSSGGFHQYTHLFILSEVFVSSPLFHLSSVIFRILSGSSYRILIFLPHLIRLGDICSIRLHLCHLSSLSPSSHLSHPSSLILTVLSHLPRHLYLYSTDQGPEHRQAFRLQRRSVRVKLQPD